MPTARTKRSRLISTFSLLSVLVLLALMTRAAVASADDDCPAGSFQKSEEGFTWCQPSVCANDGQCKPTEVCRPIPLCMEVGSLTDANAPVDSGSKRLAVTQKCAPDKTCPQKQTCSDLQRCVAKTTAEKMGILSASSAPTSSAGGGGEPAKKSSCGCRAVGGSDRGGESLGVIAFMLGVSASLRRRRRQR